jgi:very-short-patch-repair endonuclease
MKQSELEMQFQAQLESADITGFVTEYMFHPTRKWRFDFSFLDIKLAIEIEGGSWSSGRHNTGKGFNEDCIKYAEAQIHGWTVLRVTKDMITKPEQLALHYTQLLLQQRQHECKHTDSNNVA